MKISWQFTHPKSELNVYEVAEISRYYEAACTADYILDMYGERYPHLTEDLALDFGYEARHIMDKYDVSEEYAVDEVIDREARLNGW